MTEYQKIENELLSLGWSREQGSGDHIKFTKEGNPHKITVALSISDSGRALKNSYAEIRRVEPRFSLGRQPHMLKKTDDGDMEPDMPEDIPEWMYPGRSVRWTQLENRDWSKLNDPSSVMSRKYEITGYQKTDNGTMVLIRDTHEEDSKPFAVFPNEIDMWVTLSCFRCNKVFPKNWLVTGEDNMLYCEDCIDDVPSKKASAERKAPSAKKTPSERIAETDPAMRQILDTIDAMGKVYMGEMDEEIRNEALEELKKQFQNLSPKAAKTLIKDHPSLFSNISRDVNTNLTPFIAWKNAIDALIDFEIGEHASPPKELENEITRRYCSLTYSLKKVKNRSIRTKSVAHVLYITADDMETAIRVWSAPNAFQKNFIKVFTDMPVVVLVNCPSENFRQYSSDYGAEGGQYDYDSILSLLEKNLPESEKDSLSRMRLNKLLPKAKIVQDIILDAAREYGISFDNNNGIISGTTVLEEDLDHAETARPVYYTKFYFHDEPADTIDRFMEKCKASDTKQVPAIYFFSTPDRVETLDLTHDYRYPDGQFGTGNEETPEKPQTKEKQPDKTFSLGIIIHKNAEGNVQLETTTPQDSDEWIEEIATALCSCAENYKEYRKVNRLAAGIFSLRAKAEPKYAALLKEMSHNPEIFDKKTIKTNETMDNIIDHANPASSNPKLAGSTTRELLKELKERGVQFTNLTIVVRKEINMDEI